MHYLSLTRNIIFQNVDRGFLDQQTKKDSQFAESKNGDSIFACWFCEGWDFLREGEHPHPAPSGPGFSEFSWEDLSDENLVSGWTFLDVTNHSHILPNSLRRVAENLSFHIKIPITNDESPKSQGRKNQSFKTSLVTVQIIWCLSLIFSGCRGP